MIPELAHLALVLALGAALVQSTLPLVGAARQDAGLIGLANSTALVQLLLVTFAFGALVHLYMVSDFSVTNVYLNSHDSKPMIYKISGAWGNHEGSLLLWVWVLALFAGALALFGNNMPATFRARVLAVQGMVLVAFLAFTLFTSNPFERLDPAPLEGNGLNPLLQDLGLAFHPPMLYIGYVGFSVTFAFAVAALIEGRIDPSWARWMRPWILVAWSSLTLGIALGSYWAYYELGWGGWWFWDPVENASFLPWLAGTALLHSAIVVEKRDSLKTWTILLAILTFGFSLLGTFLVRSGVLTSVHAFAVDPDRGVFILAILAVALVGPLLLFAWRAPQLRASGAFQPVSREGALIVNNLLLAAATGVVLLGTLYPLLLEMVTGDKISVGPPFFNATFIPLMVPLMLVLPIGTLLAWKRGDLRRALRLMAGAGAVALGLAVVAVVTDPRSTL
ncbi:MAG: heme lyase CcmF/NrfE family subunit, partial [Pseudomonadota bacterium]